MNEHLKAYLDAINGADSDEACSDRLREMMDALGDEFAWSLVEQLPESTWCSGPP